MSDSNPIHEKTLTKEQRQILDYIGDMGFELSGLAERAGFGELSNELAASGKKARDLVHITRRE